MNRRLFLQASVAVAASHWAAARAGQPAAAFEAPDWTLGWQGTTADQYSPLSMRVEGTIPEPVRGSLYRNGPSRVARAGVHLRHWFDGDGMVQHFRLNANSASHEARFVQTEKFLEEQAAGRFIYGGAGTALPDEKPSRNNDTGNVANTSLLPWDDELLALWEGGSAYRLDPENLDTLGRKDWRDDLKHMPFSAHPLVEADGTMWNFGSAPYAGENGMIVIYRVAPGRGVQAVQSVPLPMASYMHSFAMTERYLVFYLSAHRFAGGADNFVDNFQWQPGGGSRVLLVDKNDLTSQRLFETPAGFVFHFAHAFERKGEVVARMALYPDAGVMSHGMFELMKASEGATYPDYSRARLASLRLDLTSGKSRLESNDTLIEFPGVDARHADGSTAIFGVGHASDSDARYSNAIVRVEPESGRADRYALPKWQIAEEPLFVAKPGKAGSGWLVGTFLDYAKQETGVHVLDADRLADGPVATATMARHVPLGFHGCFIPA
ncbi:MAG: carotenoid oxygenase family protein [Pseudomonadota bacterium]